MHHIETTRLPHLLARHRIRVLHDSEPRPLPAARPAPPHWTTARDPALAAGSGHDFLLLTVCPELHREP